MHQLKIKQSITNRSGTLGSYFKDVSKESFIDAEEEVRLAKRIKEGDKDALDKLVKANLRFAISVAKQYQNKDYAKQRHSLTRLEASNSSLMRYGG